MMSWLLLRSAHAGEAERTCALPPRGHDMWSALFAATCRQARASGMIARVGKSAERENDGVREVRLPVLADLPDLDSAAVVIDRGGYREYSEVHAKTPHAFRVYIGCGARWNPAAQDWTRGIPWDMVLVDTPEQARKVQQQTSATVHVLHKPAAPVFAPADVAKTYDVVYICNSPSVRKGTQWLADRLPRGTRVIRIGPEDEWFAERAKAGVLDVWFTGPLPRDEIPAIACEAGVGVVCDDGSRDSGPRVLSELMAMGLPVLLRDTVRCDHAAWIERRSGLVTSDATVAADLVALLARSRAGETDARWHYIQRFALDYAAVRLAQWIAQGVELRAQ